MLYTYVYIYIYIYMQNQSFICWEERSGRSNFETQDIGRFVCLLVVCQSCHPHTTCHFMPPVVAELNPPKV